MQNLIKLAFLYICGILLLVSTGSCATPTGTISPIPTVTPTRQALIPSVTPTRQALIPTNKPASTPISASITNPPAVVSLPEMVYLGVGGGGPPGNCIMNDTQLPYADVLFKEPSYQQDAYLCIWGLPAGKIAEISLEDILSGNILGTSSYLVGNEGIDSLVMQQQTTLIQIPLSIPLSLGLHDISIQVSVDQQTILQSVLKMPESTGCTSDYNTNPIEITHTRRPLNHPLLPVNPIFMAPYQNGDVVALQGACLPPDQDVWLGIYYGYTGGMNLVGKIQIHTNSSGSFTLDMSIDRLFLDDGFYSIIPQSSIRHDDNSNRDISRDLAMIYVQNLPFRTFTTYPTSHLRIGDRVTVTSGPPNFVRLQPDANLDSNIIGKFKPGEPVQLLDGPVEGDHIYWLGLSEETGLLGWTAEGDQMGTWLVPIR